MYYTVNEMEETDYPGDLTLVTVYQTFERMDAVRRASARSTQKGIRTNVMQMPQEVTVISFDNGLVAPSHKG